eukprot:749461-Hanusia_phi.AAC.3
MEGEGRRGRDAVLEQEVGTRKGKVERMGGGLTGSCLHKGIEKFHLLMSDLSSQEVTNQVVPAVWERFYLVQKNQPLPRATYTDTSRIRT